VLFANGAGGTRDLEGKAATGSGEQPGDAARVSNQWFKTYPPFFRNFGSQISHMKMERQSPMALHDGGWMV
jgi:hypothetical protein